MARHLSTGKMGEELAAKYLAERGFRILYQNWRYKHLEVDIIAAFDDVLHFIEVKTRSSDKFGYPEEGVSRKKLLHIMDAAEEYQYQNPEWKKIQFDILAIRMKAGEETEYFLIEDVYV
ncbi:MAG: YraN family protein [Chitinophagaceae bacterium]|nr:YraN family protein [Chitinophagaceae bacterium]